MSRPMILALAILCVGSAFALADPAIKGVPKAPASGNATTSDPAEAGSIRETHTGGDKANTDILEPQAPLAIWTVVVFVGLLLVLGKYAWGPLAKALHDREQSMAHTLSEAERVKKESEELLVRHQALIAGAADQSRLILDEARKVAETTAAEIVRKAQEEAESSRTRAAREIEGARDQALIEIWDKTASLAVSVAGKVLSRDLNPDDQRRLVEVALSEMPSANGHGGAKV